MHKELIGKQSTTYVNIFFINGLSMLVRDGYLEQSQ